MRVRISSACRARSNSRVVSSGVRPPRAAAASRGYNTSRLPDYPNVKNAHIVPRTYLANWAEDDRIATHLKGDPELRIRRISKVGTRRRFYRRHRPDGTPIDDIEWALGRGEDAATPILRTFDERWPLVEQDRGAVAELFAAQLVYSVHTARSSRFAGGTEC
jgi:Protein of unknown function (DUF4238)